MAVLLSVINESILGIIHETYIEKLIPHCKVYIDNRTPHLHNSNNNNNSNNNLWVHFIVVVTNNI